MAKDLVTVAEYKTYADISSTTFDSQLAVLIPSVSQMVKTICRQSFIDYISDFKVEVFNGGHGPQLYLAEGPLLRVSSVEYSADYGNTYTELVEFTDYVVDEEYRAIQSLGSDGFPRMINGYKVTYTAGYENGIPGDLKLAVFDLITYYLKNDTAIHSPKAPGTNSVQIEYVSGSKLPAHINRVLTLYTGAFD